MSLPLCRFCNNGHDDADCPTRRPVGEQAPPWDGPSYFGMELFCREGGGWVEVVDSEERQVLRLSLAAAEDLSHMLSYNAKWGRHRAAATTPAGRSPE